MPEPVTMTILGLGAAIKALAAGKASAVATTGIGVFLEWCVDNADSLVGAASDVAENTIEQSGSDVEFESLSFDTNPQEIVALDSAASVEPWAPPVVYPPGQEAAQLAEIAELNERRQQLSDYLYQVSADRGLEDTPTLKFLPAEYLNAQGYAEAMSNAVENTIILDENLLKGDIRISEADISHELKHIVQYNNDTELSPYERELDSDRAAIEDLKRHMIDPEPFINSFDPNDRTFSDTHPSDALRHDLLRKANQEIPTRHYRIGSDSLFDMQ